MILTREGDEPSDRAIAMRYDDLLAALYCSQVLRKPILELGDLYPPHGYI